MFARNKKFIHTVRILLLGAPLMLAACHSDIGPYPMPTGYHYHDRLPPTPPGPEPVMKKIEHMRTPESVDRTAGSKCTPCVAPVPAAAPMTAPPAPLAAVSAGEWDFAANDLVQRLASQFGVTSEPVFIDPADPASGYEVELEKALRAALLEHGFVLAQTPGLSPYVLDYTVTGLAGMDSGRMMVKIMLKGHQDLVSEQSGLYDIARRAPVGAPLPEPHVHSGPAMSHGAPLPIMPE